MELIVDTREHDSEWVRIKAQFDELGIKYFRSKLFVGDYQSLDNARLVVDRKKDLQELCGNVCQQHERFRAELQRAQDANIKIMILCEHGADIKSLEDVAKWKNPRKQGKFRTVNGKKVWYQVSPRAMDGPQLYKVLKTMKEKYGVEFYFCEKDKTGQKIVELLSNAE